MDFDENAYVNWLYSNFIQLEYGPRILNDKPLDYFMPIEKRNNKNRLDFTWEFALQKTVDVPNKTTQRAIEELKEGKTIKCRSFEEYLAKVK